MKRNKVISIGVIICIFILWFFPYMKYELLTWKNGAEFSGLQKTTNMIGDVDYLKVLDYSVDSARVYYVGESGNILTFIQNNERWELVSWKTIWSKSGSADNFIWPYFYHSSEGIGFIIIIGIFLTFSISIFFLIAKTIRRKMKAHE